MASSNIIWFAVIFCIFHLISAKHIHHCPVDCQCTNNKTSISSLHCNSLKFISKLTPKEIELVTSLDISSIKMHSLDQKLKKLINLEVLDLSHNKLTDLKHFPHLAKLTHLHLKGNLLDSFSAKHLPSTLTYLDISHNKIEELPQDITRLTSLRHLDLHGNSFSCNRDSLDVRDSLLDQHVDISGSVTCFDPPQLKGQSWVHAVDFDEYFKLHPDEQMLGDQPEGSGDVDTNEASGFGPLIVDEVMEKKVEPKLEAENPTTTTTTTTTTEVSTTDSDFAFVDESGSGDGISNSHSDLSDGRDSEITPLVKVNSAAEDPEDKHANLGTNIFLGVFLLCLLALLIYAVKKNKERKREQRKQRREERLKQKAAIELMPKNLDRKPSDKQNGNPEASVPLMNGQNGKSDPLKDVENGLLQASAPLLSSEPSNGDTVLLYQPDVKSVKVKASEIPDSVPQTPILVNRNRNSDGKVIVTPNSNQRNV